MTQADVAPDTGVDERAEAATASRPSNWVFRTGVTIIVVVAVVWRYWTLSSWSWFQDDWIYVTRTTELPFWDYITQNYNGHVMPAQFVIAWLITKVAPLDYSYAVATTVFFTIASLLAWAAALRTIFGERLRLLYPLIILSISPVFMPINLWWAAAIQTFPLQLFMGLCVLFTARYVMRAQGGWDLAALAASYGLGLLFWQKALLLLVPIGFVAILVGTGSVQQRLTTVRRVLTPVLAITAAYVPAYLLLTRQEDDANTTLFKPRELSDSLNFFLTGIVDIGIPSLLGGPWRALSEPQQVFGSSSGVLTLGFIVISVVGAVAVIRLRTLGWVVVAMTVVYAAAAWGLLFTSSRYDAVGVFLVRDARYSADIVAVGLLAVIFATTPTLNERSWRKRHWESGMPAWSWRAMAGALVAFVSLSAVYTNGRIWDASAPASPKSWVDNLASDLRSMPPGTSVYDSNAPDHVMFAVYFAEEARISSLFRPLAPPVAFNEPSERIYIADWGGRLMEAEVETAAGPAAEAPVPGCGYLVGPGRATRIPLDPELYNWEWGYQLSYFSGNPAIVSAKASTTSVDVPIRKGLHQVQFVLEDSASALVLTGHPDSDPVCVTEVRAGSLKPSDRWIGDLRPR
ncbi:MAG TPA: hypothetical protein VFY88_08950 [Intrasporangium sp.]|nr:hypothetical protein [Intrasporangium sp.]